MKRAILATDRNPHYAFFAPATAKLWSQRGYKPTVVLVGTPEEWLANPQTRLVVERTREVGAELHWTPEREGVRSSTVAQCARIFATLLPGIDPDDVLTTSDMDMFILGDWPGANVNDHELVIQYSNAYDGMFSWPQWPMCYLNAHAYTWREIIDAPGDQTFDAALDVALAKAPKEQAEAWSFDEKYLGGRIATWRAYPENVDLVREIPRTFVHGEWRLDRSAWDDALRKLNGSLDGVADAHLPRPGYGDEWLKIAPVLALAAPNMFEWFNEYHNEWMLHEDDKKWMLHANEITFAGKGRMMPPLTRAPAPVTLKTTPNRALTYVNYHKTFFALADERCRAYWGNSDAPNGHAAGLESLIHFAGMVSAEMEMEMEHPNTEIVVCDAGAGVSSAILRTYFKHVITCDPDPEYLAQVRRACEKMGLGHGTWVTGVPEGKWTATFYDYGASERIPNLFAFLDKTERYFWLDDAHDRELFKTCKEACVMRRHVLQEIRETLDEHGRFGAVAYMWFRYDE